jgi:hypothetical protein
VTVHAGHLELVLEIGHGAQAAQQDAALHRAHEVRQQGVEADDFDVVMVRQRTARKLYAQLQRQRRSLRWTLCNAHHYLFEQRCRPVHQVDVTIGDRVEGARIDSDATVCDGHGRS